MKRIVLWKYIEMKKKTCLRNTISIIKHWQIIIQNERWKIKIFAYLGHDRGGIFMASTKIQHNQSSIQQYIPVSSNESDVTETVDHHFHAITRQKCTMNVTHMTYRTTRLTEESLINNKSTFVMRYKENLRDQMVNTFTLAR